MCGETSSASCGNVGVVFEAGSVCLVRVSRFQMRVHHPCGCHDDASGGWAADDAQWKVREVRGRTVNLNFSAGDMHTSEKSGEPLRTALSRL